MEAGQLQGGGKVPHTPLEAVIKEDSENPFTSLREVILKQAVLTAISSTALNS